MENFEHFVNSPSNYHLIKRGTKILRSVEFIKLNPKEKWDLEKKGKYLYTHGDNTLIAFIIGGKWLPGNGVTVVTANANFPCLKLKDVTYVQNGLQCVATETYGKADWSSFADRDLKLAGKVFTQSDKKNHFESCLVDIKDRSFVCSNKNNKLSIIWDEIQYSSKEPFKLKEELMKLMKDEKRETNLLDFDLVLTDSLPAKLCGFKKEFFHGSRVSSILNCFAALTALKDVSNDENTKNDTNCKIVFLLDGNSATSKQAKMSSAQILENFLKRLNGSNCGSCELNSDVYTPVNANCTFEQSMAKSMLLVAGEDSIADLDKLFVLKKNRSHQNRFLADTLLKMCLEKGDVSPLYDVEADDEYDCTAEILSSKLSVIVSEVVCPVMSKNTAREMVNIKSLQKALTVFKAFFINFSKVFEHNTIEMELN